MRLRSSFADYERDLSATTRETFRRKVRKFSAAHGRGSPFRACVTPEDVEGFLSAARQVSAVSYQERFLGLGIPKDRVFRDRLIRQCTDRKAAGCLLYLGDRPVAYMLCEAVDDGVLLYGPTGYDSSVGHLSPGSVLHYLFIEFLHRVRMFHVYDLNLGEAEHKRHLANEECPCADILFVRATPWGAALAGGYLASQEVNGLRGRIGRRVVRWRRPITARSRAV